MDTSILIKRKIIEENQDINAFFDDISNKIFPNLKEAQALSLFLKSGHIALSTSAYSNIDDPKSAIALCLDPKKDKVQHLELIENYIKNSVGIGLNLSNFKNPIETLTYINKYLKQREPNLNRPPAGIALLNIDHPKVIDFITIKNSRDYENWCFNLSVVIDDEFLNNKNKNVYQTLLNSMLVSGEPGIIFSNNKNFICDSCAASELKENEGLNLSQINLSKFYNNEIFDFNLLQNSSEILSLAMKNLASNGFISILGYQDLLEKMNIKYGSKEALELLENCLKTIKTQANKNNIRMCISPSGATSRILKTTPSIEPSANSEITYLDEINTMKIAQKYLEGGISKTIILKKTHTIQDIKTIIEYSKQSNLKGITVFPIQ